MDDGQKSESTPEAPAPVFLGQTFGEAQKPVFQSTPQPHLEGANSPIYVKNELQWGESNPPPPSFRWGQFFIGFFAPIAVVVFFGFIADFADSGQYDDLYGYEDMSVSPDENGHYSAPISVRPGHEVDYCSIYADEWSAEEVFCEVKWDDTLEVRQYLEPIAQIQPLAFAMDEENGTFSVSYNGTLINANDVSGRLITSNGNLYDSIFAADHETDNTTSTSYLNSTFTPTNQTLYIYVDAFFFSSNEVLEVHSCEGAFIFHQCTANQTETGYAMSVSWLGEREHVQIGEFTNSNETLWFIPNGDELTSYSVYIQTYDRELDESLSNQDMVFEGVFCMMPLVYIGAIIFSFVKGKNALGWGLLSSSFFSILLFFGFIALLILSFGGGF
jgi:nitrogen fixation-related uncharacterized protein